jgi:hypothetical protein
MRESVVEREVCEFATGRGWLVRKLQWIGRCNAPDRFFARKKEPCPTCGCDYEIALPEFKAPGEKPRRGQEKEIKRLQKHGVPVPVVDSIEQGRNLFA